MILNKIILQNFRGFNFQEIDLHPRITLFIGINGAGKTSVLDAISILLSYLVSGILNERSTGKQIKLTDIKNGKSRAIIDILTTNPEASWTRSKALRKDPEKYEGLEISALANQEFIDYRTGIYKSIISSGSKTNSPIFVFYPVNRALIEIPLRLRKKREFDSLEAYESAVTPNVGFKYFFEWFRNREDLENETKLIHISEASKNGSQNYNLYQDPQLSAVRHAIGEFMPDFTELKVRRNPLRMTVTKNGNTLEIGQLSDGEKCTLALVGDIARRLAIANPMKENPLEGEGIILIDEIELHLHPKWQRDLIKRLPIIFPNCQFLLSTHSPQAIGELQPESIRVLFRDENNDLKHYIPDQSFGLTTNEILQEIMDSEIQNKSVSDHIDLLSRLIDSEKWSEAVDLMATIKSNTNGSISELVRAESLMTMLREDLND